MYKNPKVGVGVLIFNEENKLLIIQRNSKRAEGKGAWSPPGGYVSWGEHFFDAAKRELLEEVGINLNKKIVDNVELFSVTSEILPTYHSVTIWVLARYNNSKIKINPTEVKDFCWSEVNNLPKPIFEPFRQLIMTKEWMTKNKIIFTTSKE